MRRSCLRNPGYTPCVPITSPGDDICESGQGRDEKISPAGRNHELTGALDFGLSKSSTDHGTTAVPLTRGSILSGNHVVTAGHFGSGLVVYPTGLKKLKLIYDRCLNAEEQQATISALRIFVVRGIFHSIGERRPKRGHPRAKVAGHRSRCWHPCPKARRGC
jgi:hypothetical protein